MAIYHCHVKTVSRSSGASAVAGAAYRSGTKIRDERTDKIHDYGRKSDVGHSMLFGWDGDRAELWNCAEQTDTRKNATTAREYEVAIPHELSPEERIALAEQYSAWIHERHGVAVDLNIHDLKGDKPHAHILTTTRESKGDSLGDKVAREWSDKRRKQNGLPGRKQDLLEAREKWSELANQYLAADNRIDHRSYAAQGIKKNPQVKLGKSTYHFHKRTGEKNERYERWMESIEQQSAANDPFDEVFTFADRYGLTGTEMASNYEVEFRNVMFLDHSLQPSPSTYDIEQTKNTVHIVANDESLIDKLRAGVKKAAKRLRDSIPAIMNARQKTKERKESEQDIKRSPVARTAKPRVEQNVTRPAEIDQQRQREYERQQRIKKRQEERERAEKAQAEKDAEIERQHEQYLEKQRAQDKAKSTEPKPKNKRGGRR